MGVCFMQLGHELGDARIHHDVQESIESMWDRQLRLLPNCVEVSPTMMLDRLLIKYSVFQKLCNLIL